jgi:hypothetical protein
LGGVSIFTTIGVVSGPSTPVISTRYSGAPLSKAHTYVEAPGAVLGPGMVSVGGLVSMMRMVWFSAPRNLAPGSGSHAAQVLSLVPLAKPSDKRPFERSSYVLSSNSPLTSASVVVTVFHAFAQRRPVSSMSTVSALFSTRRMRRTRTEVSGPPRACSKISLSSMAVTHCSQACR